MYWIQSSFKERVKMFCIFVPVPKERGPRGRASEGPGSIAISATLRRNIMRHSGATRASLLIIFMKKNFKKMEACGLSGGCDAHIGKLH